MAFNEPLSLLTYSKMQSTLQSPQKQSGFVRVTAKTLTRAYSSGPISTTVAKDTVILLDFDTKKTSKQELEKLGIDLNELIEGVPPYCR